MQTLLENSAAAGKTFEDILMTVEDWFVADRMCSEGSNLFTISGGKSCNILLYVPVMSRFLRVVGVTCEAHSTCTSL
jgi:hypothetical protein